MNGCYLTYSEDFQRRVVNSKLSGNKVKDICSEFGISVYTLYKILRFNAYLPIPSEASEGDGSEERVEHRDLSPNNNNLQEPPASKPWYMGDRHITVEHKCLNCNKTFYKRDRGDRTKFCSIECKNLYNTLNNSSELMCDNCGRIFRVKNSILNNRIHCDRCKKLHLKSPSSKTARLIGEWLSDVLLWIRKNNLNGYTTRINLKDGSS